eukprot:1184029-Prorocentrum_minimum.AAC.2
MLMMPSQVRAAEARAAALRAEKVTRGEERAARTAALAQLELEEAEEAAEALAVSLTEAADRASSAAHDLRDARAEAEACEESEERAYTAALAGMVTSVVFMETTERSITETMEGYRIGTRMSKAEDEAATELQAAEAEAEVVNAEYDHFNTLKIAAEDVYAAAAKLERESREGLEYANERAKYCEEAIPGLREDLAAKRAAQDAEEELLQKQGKLGVQMDMGLGNPDETEEEREARLAALRAARTAKKGKAKSKKPPADQTGHILLVALMVPEEYAEADLPFAEAYAARAAVQEELKARVEELAYAGVERVRLQTVLHQAEAALAEATAKLNVALSEFEGPNDRHNANIARLDLARMSKAAARLEAESVVVPTSADARTAAEVAVSKAREATCRAHERAGGAHLARTSWAAAA